jgi:hypothetical protein
VKPVLLEDAEKTALEDVLQLFCPVAIVVERL